MPSLTLLVTANHQGDLDYLPRLYTRLLKLRSDLEGEVFLIDAGHAWSENSGICNATENRAPYIVLDAMGYHFAFADGLSEERRVKLSDTVQVELVPDQSEALLNLHDHSLKILADQTLTEPEIRDTILRLDLPSYGMIRLVELAIEQEGTDLLQSDLVPVSGRILPDPTITATVEFVESEARYYQKKKGDAHERG